MEFTTLEDNLDLVADMISRWIFPDYEISRRLLWEMLFSQQCFANEFCHYLNEKTPNLFPEDAFHNLPSEPILPVIIPVDNYKNAIMLGIFVDDFSSHVDDLITRIEGIVTNQPSHNDRLQNKAFIANLSQQHLLRLASYTPFGMPATPGHIYQWREIFPQHEWFKLKSETNQTGAYP